MLCIQTQDTMDNPNRFRFSNHEFYLKSSDEMYQLMAGRFGEEMLQRTVEIAERCSAEVGLGAMHLPRFEVPRAGTPSPTCATWPSRGCASATDRRRPSCGAGSSSS